MFSIDKCSIYVVNKKPDRYVFFFQNSRQNSLWISDSSSHSFNFCTQAFYTQPIKKRTHKVSASKPSQLSRFNKSNRIIRKPNIQSRPKL